MLKASQKIGGEETKNIQQESQTECSKEEIKNIAGGPKESTVPTVADEPKGSSRGDKKLYSKRGKRK